MKKLLIILCLWSVARAQNVPGYSYQNTGIGNLRFFTNDLLGPAGTTPVLQSGSWGRAGHLFVDTTGGNKGLYYYINGTFIRVYDTTNSVASFLSNVGNGFSIGVAGTSNVKKIRDSLYIVADSSISGTIRFHIDTNSLFTAVRATIPANIPEVFSNLSGSTWDVSVAAKKTKTLTANTNITITNSTAGLTSAVLVVSQDGTGGRTLTINGTLVPIDSLHDHITSIGILDIGGGLLSFDPNISSIGGNLAVSVVDITFPTAVDLGVGVLVNTSGVWTANGTSSVFGKTGLSNLKLPAGTDGYIRTQNVSGYNNAFFGFLTTNTQPTGSSDLLYGYTISANDVYRVDNGGFSGTPVASISVNDYVRINRIGGNATLQTSSDGFVWTTVYTYSISNNGDIYIGTDVYGNNQGKMFYPQGFGLLAINMWGILIVLGLSVIATKTEEKVIKMRERRRAA